jgi:hypothetical protein
MLLFLLACHQNISFETTSKDPTVAWSDLVAKISREDGIDFEKLKENRSVLEDYLAWVGENGPRMNRIKKIKWQRKGRENRRISYYANAYNAWTLYEIMEHYPLDSVEGLPLDTFSLFGKAYRVDGEYLSLYHLKEERILSVYQEPMLHMMLHDGSMSSPKLQYWKYSQLNLALKNKMWRYLESEQGAKKIGESWTLPALFQIEEDDFLYWSESETLCQYLSKYVEKDLEAWLNEQDQQNCQLEFQSWDYTL